MDVIGLLEGMNFKPIGDYNSYLKNNLSIDIDSNMDFENILSKQTESLKNISKIQGQVEMNTDMSNLVGRNSVQGIDESSPTGNFIKSFENSLSGGLNSVNDAVVKADKAQEAFAAGENVSVHDVMIAAEKASLSLQMAMQLRNKLVQAYNEINGVKV